MTIFNLVDQEKSDIKYKISQFPDGQQTIDIINIENSLWNNDEIQLKSRLNSFRDLELIICAKQALNNLNRRNVHLYVPYFLGARSDRKFQSGGVNYLKDVISPIINAQNFLSVTVMDPHSDVLEACINNFVKINNFSLVEYTLTNLNLDTNKLVLVSPDAGAYKKVYDLAKKFNIEKIIAATKVRDLKTGNILQTEIPVLDQHNDLTYIIVDDICDGGRTFVELAKVIKESRATAKIYLVVTHGIFSVGFEFLSEYFENIFCTNSVKEIGDGIIVNTFSKNKTIYGLVKQMNVF
jgi:ribose-phosphate pyrophosphokinase